MPIGNIYLLLPIVDAGLFGSLFNKDEGESVKINTPKGGLFSSLDSTPWMSKVKNQRPLELPKIQLRNGKRPIYTHVDSQVPNSWKSEPMTFTQDFKSFGGSKQKVPAKMQRIPKYGKAPKKKKTIADEMKKIQSAFPSFDQPEVQLKSASSFRDPNVNLKNGFRNPTESLGVNLKGEDKKQPSFRPPSAKTEKKPVVVSSKRESPKFPYKEKNLEKPKVKKSDPNISRSPGQPKGLFGNLFHSKPSDDGEAKVVNHVSEQMKKYNRVEAKKSDDQGLKFKEDMNDPFASSFAKFDKIMAESKAKKHQKPGYHQAQEQFEAEFDPVWDAPKNDYEQYDSYGLYEKPGNPIEAKKATFLEGNADDKMFEFPTMDFSSDEYKIRDQKKSVLGANRTPQKKGLLQRVTDFIFTNSNDQAPTSPAFPTTNKLDNNYRPPTSSGGYRPPSGSGGQYRPPTSWDGQYRPPSNSNDDFRPPPAWQTEKTSGSGSSSYRPPSGSTNYRPPSQNYDDEADYDDITAIESGKKDINHERVWNAVNGYGCWCHLDRETMQNARGNPVDELDELCKRRHQAMECMVEDGCDPYNTRTRIKEFFGQSHSYYNRVCPKKNAKQENPFCSSNLCVIEATFVTDAMRILVQHGRNPKYTHYRPGFNGHTKVRNFNYEQRCKTQAHDLVTASSGGKSGGRDDRPQRPETQCCGEYPLRMPFDTKNRSVGCCKSQSENQLGVIYDRELKECCADGTVFYKEDQQQCKTFSKS